jgi:hypothetical protein
MEGHLRITARERQALLEQYRHGATTRVRLRAHILLLLAEGYSWALIAGVLFCSTRTLARWKARVERPQGWARCWRPLGPRLHAWGGLVARGGGGLGHDPQPPGLWLLAQSVVLWGDCPAVDGDL